jgi:GT2 family glycosyltransferase
VLTVSRLGPRCYYPSLRAQRASVIIPTLSAGEKLARCLNSLRDQTFQEFETIVVDNSGHGAAAEIAGASGARLIENNSNAGFGGAVNQGIEASEGEFVCTLNDDAYPAPQWLESLVGACEKQDRAGMCASQILLRGQPGRLDSTGLDIYGDGTTKQRQHGEPRHPSGTPSEALIPSGCAALYRRSMLDEIGLFDADYFLYCEDTDLGLRGRLAGWTCLYVPAAVVEHDYSSTAGRASAEKAYFVERNRIYTVLKVFPVFLWPLVPWYSLWRYAAHSMALLQGRGLASEFAGGKEKWWRLAIIVLSAQWSVLLQAGTLLRKRRAVQRTAALTGMSFWRLLRQHNTKATDIAAQ